MQVGLIGFCGSGKSTLFQALTGALPDPVAVMKGQSGVAAVDDIRLDKLYDHYQPERKVKANIEFVDTPGLLTDKEGNNPQRIAVLRTTDGLIVVLNGFTGSNDLLREMKLFMDELIFADLLLLMNRIERIQESLSKGANQAERRKLSEELEIVQQFSKQLEDGKTQIEYKENEPGYKLIKGFQLFCLKPKIILVNIDEKCTESPVLGTFLSEFPDAVILSARLAKELSELDEADRVEFMKALDVKETAKNQLIKKAYEMIGLISFFTVGQDECRAWTIKNGDVAVTAASKIHSDIARGFIRAEVASFEDFTKLGDMKKIKAQGLFRLEGKDYVVKDGDIIEFRFNV